MVAGRGYVMVCMCFLGLSQQWRPLQHSKTDYELLVDQCRSRKATEVASVMAECDG